MKPTETMDLRDILIDAHAHFFFLKGDQALRLNLWEIRKDSLIIERPKGAPLRATVLGYVPTLDGGSVYEIEGRVVAEPLADQMPGSIRIDVDSSNVRKVNRRLFPRVSFAPPLEAAIATKDKKHELQGRIINLSAGGLRVETTERLSPGEDYTFRFEIETDDEVHDLNLSGLIVYELPLEKGYAYGVKFGREEKGEAPVEVLDQTVDLMGLVNKLLVREA